MHFWQEFDRNEECGLVTGSFKKSENSSSLNMKKKKFEYEESCVAMTETSKSDQKIYQ